MGEVMCTSRHMQVVLALAVVTTSCLAGCENPFWPCPQDLVPPVVVGTAPAEGENDVEPDSVVRVTFDKPMNVESVNAETFFVHSEVGPVEGAISFDETGRLATFAPSGGLILSATYTAQVSAEVADAQGNLLGADKSWQFTVRDGTWDTPVVISGSGQSTKTAPVARNNPAGDVIVIWRESDDGQTPVWSNRYVPGSGWETPVNFDVQADDTHEIVSEELVVDSTGNAIAVWVQFESSSVPRRLLASRYTVGTGWSAPVVVQDRPHKSVSDVSSVVVDDDGNVFLFWRQCSTLDDGTPSSVWVVHYDPSAGWNPPEQLSDANWSAAAAAVSRQDSGRILIAWREVSSTQQRIVARCYDCQVGWRAPEILTQVEDEQTGSPHLAQNGTGDAMVSWWQTEQLWFSRYTPSTGWTAAGLIAPESNAQNHALAMDTVGNVTSLWVGSYNSGAARYSPGDGWSEPYIIDYGTTVTTPRIDPFGNVLLVWHWHIYTDLERIWSTRYDIEEGWQVTEELGIADRLSRHALDPLGNAVLAWTANELQLEGDEENPIEPPDAPTVGVWLRRYVVGNGWTQAERLDNRESVSYDLCVLIDGRGRVTLVWKQDSRIWACRYE
jgi:hypothetical protein